MAIARSASVTMFRSPVRAGRRFHTEFAEMILPSIRCGVFACSPVILV